MIENGESTIKYSTELKRKRRRKEGWVNTIKFYSAQQVKQEMRDNKRKKKRLVQND